MLKFLFFLAYCALLIPLLRSIYYRRNFKKYLKITLTGIIILTLFIYFLNIYIDALWFKNLSFLKRYLKELSVRWLLFATGFIIPFLIIFFSSKGLPQWLRFLTSGFISLIFGIILQSKWLLILQYLNRTDAGLKEPIFAKDVSFYLFTYPFLRLCTEFLIWLFLICIIFLIFKRLYRITYTFEPFFTSAFLHEIRPYLFAFFILIALRTYIAKYGLLYSERGVVTGASYADIKVQLPAYLIFSAISIVSAILLFFSKNLVQLRNLLIFYFASYIVICGIIPSAFHALIVAPNEIVMEKPYIKHNIKFTRYAYNLHKCKEKEFDIKGEPTSETIKKYENTLKNIRLWDWRALLLTYKQIQEIRLYYRFTDVDIDRYYINGELREVMVSPRELDQDLLPDKSKTWVNLRLKYTHGYGVCLAPVNEFTAGGLPNLLIKDMPPKIKVKDLKLTEPRIYYGELTDRVVYVNTKTKEFDYPAGDKNVYTEYKGKGGIKLKNFLIKLGIALKFDGIRFLISRYITKDSRALLYRNIKKRVKKICPFLEFDHDPYIVIANGKLYFIIDAYTVTDKFPYSERIKTKWIEKKEKGKVYYRKINYIRNSVKTVVDAYNGDVKFYIIDKEDVLIKCYRKIFPDLFRDIKEMPREIYFHIRYPDDLLEIQAEVYRIYHMTEPEVFYNKEDAWEIAKELYIDKTQKVTPYFIIAEIRGKPEFINILPFTPIKKNNMIAWICGICDTANYGELIVYKFPKEKLVYGPMQIEARIDQDPVMSAQITLWNQQGSQIIRGNLLVIPLGNTIIYVEPIFLQAVASKMPEFRKVVVATQEKIVWADTFKEAIDLILKGIPLKIKEEKKEKLKPEDLINKAEKLIKELEKILKKLKEIY